MWRDCNPPDSTQVAVCACAVYLIKGERNKLCQVSFTFVSIHVAYTSEFQTIAVMKRGWKKPWLLKPPKRFQHVAAVTLLLDCGFTRSGPDAEVKVTSSAFHRFHLKKFAEVWAFPEAETMSTAASSHTWQSCCFGEKLRLKNKLYRSLSF